MCNYCTVKYLESKYGKENLIYTTLGNFGMGGKSIYIHGEPAEGQGEPTKIDGKPVRFLGWFMEIGSYCTCSDYGIEFYDDDFEY